MRALIIGDIHVIAGGRLDRFPEPGANVILSEGYSAVSGVATNIAISLASLDVDVSVAAAVGQDSFGDTVLGELEAQSIDVSRVQRCEEPTSVFLIAVDDVGERTMLGFRGAMERFRLEPDLLERVRPDWVHIAGYTMLNPGMPESFRELAVRARQVGIACSVELEGLAQAGVDIDLEGLTVFCNRHEHLLYFGRKEVTWLEGTERLVVKSGNEGCFLADEAGVHHIPAVPATVHDLTGAGDAFNAAFIAARLRGLSAPEACRWGNAAGSLKIGVPGPRVELTERTLQEVVRRVYGAA